MTMKALLPLSWLYGAAVGIRLPAEQEDADEIDLGWRRRFLVVVDLGDFGGAQRLLADVEGRNEAVICERLVEGANSGRERRLRPTRHLQ